MEFHTCILAWAPWVNSILSHHRRPSLKDKIILAFPLPCIFHQEKGLCMIHENVQKSKMALPTEIHNVFVKTLVAITPMPKWYTPCSHRLNSLANITLSWIKFKLLNLTLEAGAQRQVEVILHSEHTAKLPCRLTYPSRTPVRLDLPYKSCLSLPHLLLISGSLTKLTSEYFTGQKPSIYSMNTCILKEERKERKLTVAPGVSNISQGEMTCTFTDHLWAWKIFSQKAEVMRGPQGINFGDDNDACHDFKIMSQKWRVSIPTYLSVVWCG